MKKIIILILCLIVITPAFSFHATSSIPQLEDGILKVGTDCAYAPYSFATVQGASDTAAPIAGNSGYCDGYDIMIAKNVADYLGVDLEVQVISFDGLIPALNSGQIDVIAAGMTATPERREQIDFTNNYHDDDINISIVLSTDSEYASAQGLNDFNGATLSSQLGTFHGDLLNQIPGVNIASPMEGYDGLMQATQSGTIDGYITESEPAKQQVSSDSSLTQIQLPTGENGLDVSAYVGTAMGVKKGSDEFVAELNAALETITPDQRDQYMITAEQKADEVEIEGDSFLSQTWNLFISNIDLYKDGLMITLLLAIFGTIFGTIIGFILVAMRVQQAHYKDKKLIKVVKKLISTCAVIYIDIVRGTPMMVQAMLFYYGIASDIMSANVAGIVIISLNTGAYIAEILRSGVNAIDDGQMEAGKALGLTYGQTFMNVIVPQTLKNTIPALCNELIVNIKDSSVLSVIAVSELFFATKQAASAGYMYTQSYLIAAIIYLILTMSLTRILNMIMKKYLNNGNEKMISLQNMEEGVKYD